MVCGSRGSGERISRHGTPLKEHVFDELDRLGITMPYMVPIEDNDDIRNIANMAPRQISKNRGELVANLSYILPQIAAIEIDCIALHRAVESAKASFIARSTEAQWKVKELLHGDENYVSACDRYDRALGVKLMLESVQRVHEEKINALSRELSRRELEARA